MVLDIRKKSEIRLKSEDSVITLLQINCWVWNHHVGLNLKGSQNVTIFQCVAMETKNADFRAQFHREGLRLCHQYNVVIKSMFAKI